VAPGHFAPPLAGRPSATGQPCSPSHSGGDHLSHEFETSLGNPAPVPKLKVSRGDVKRGSEALRARKRSGDFKRRRSGRGDGRGKGRKLRAAVPDPLTFGCPSSEAAPQRRGLGAQGPAGEAAALRPHPGPPERRRPQPVRGRPAGPAAAAAARPMSSAAEAGGGRRRYSRRAGAAPSSSPNPNRHWTPKREKATHRPFAAAPRFRMSSSREMSAILRHRASGEQLKRPQPASPPLRPLWSDELLPASD
jgi:hypothetical protein